MRTGPAMLAVLALAMMATGAAAKPHSFIVIGDDGSPTEAVAVSADGSVVVGSYHTPDGQRAFLWTQSGGRVPLDQPTDLAWSWATDVSASGDYVSGYGGSSFGTRDGWEGIRWQVGGDFDRIAVPGSAVWAAGISGDGLTIAGTVQGVPAADLAEAFRWTPSGGVQNLGTLYDDLSWHQSNARGISNDGATIIGDSQGSDGTNFYADGYRWTEADNMTGLGGAFSANAVSRDGQVVVGAINTNEGFRAYRWTQADGFDPLGTLGPNQTSAALGVSGDGRRVVGYVEDQGTDLRTAFVWDEGKGMRLLQDVLVNEFGFGNELDGWTLTKVYAVSDDGSTLVGRGYYQPDPEQSGQDLAFRAVFPEPATLSFLALGGLLALRGRWRQGAAQ